ncbi:hypothetical protein QF028_003354 [Neobacillus sp. B4I6]
MKCEFCFNHQATWAFLTEKDLRDICSLCLETEIEERGGDLDCLEFYEL